MGKTILVVDDDPEMLQMVCSALSKHGHTVETACDGKEGLDKALRIKPDLIITDVVMPVMDGWSLADKLRDHRELILVPLIFLTALDEAEHRSRGFHLGAVDYLPKPFRLDALEVKVYEALFVGAGLEGTLDQMNLATVLNILEMERKSGILMLSGERDGRLFLNQGRIIDASFDDSAPPEGVQAVYEMLRWTTGKFQFHFKDIQMQDRIDTSITHLLIEAARLADEATQDS